MRDTRRAGQAVGGTNQWCVKTTHVDVTAPADASEPAPAGPPVLGAPHRWSPRSPLLDYPNNGYT